MFRTRSKILILAMVFMLTQLFCVSSFADQPYRGEARHKRSLRDASISRADDTYEDRNGDTHDSNPDMVSISFTSDMEQNMELYSRVGTYFEEESGHYPRSFMIDAGNYSDSFPYSVVFGQSAPGLRIMGSAGYDIATLGASEIKQGGTKLQQMLRKAVDTEETLPYLTVANVAGTNALQSAFRNYGINDYLDMNKYRTEIAVFSVIGKDAFDNANPDKIRYSDAVDTAKKIVKEIREDEEADIVICVCNSGLGVEDEDKALEKKIAKSVKGIDFIISTGSTTEIEKPIKVGGTRIVSLAAGESKLGRIMYEIEDNTYHYSAYETVSLNKEYKKDGDVEKKINAMTKAADKNFFAANGFNSGQVLAESFFEIPAIKENTGMKGSSAMGELVSDAYRYSAMNRGKLPKGNMIGIASDLSASGGIGIGKVTVNDIYKIMSDGRSANGSKGMALTSFYISGKDLYKLAEYAAATYEDTEKARFYFSGLNYKYNPHRFKEARVYDITVFEDDPALGIKLADDTMYRIVTDTATAEALNGVKFLDDTELDYADENGAKMQALEELQSSVGENVPLKTWVALSEYVETFHEAGIAASYKKPDGRMIYDDSKAFSHVYKGQFFTLLTTILVALVGIIAAFLLVLLILNLAGVKHIRKPGQKKE